jgi:hypothetical protein
MLVSLLHNKYKRNPRGNEGVDAREPILQIPGNAHFHRSTKEARELYVDGLTGESSGGCLCEMTESAVLWQISQKVIVAGDPLSRLPRDWDRSTVGNPEGPIGQCCQT